MPIYINPIHIETMMVAIIPTRTPTPKPSKYALSYDMILIYRAFNSGEMGKTPQLFADHLQLDHIFAHIPLSAASLTSLAAGTYHSDTRQAHDDDHDPNQYIHPNIIRVAV
jgi:hypothetical protein